METKKLLKMSAFFAVVTGIILIIGGSWGIYFTYQNVTQENIVTPDDASIAGAKVKGPFTLKAQADVIRKHTLSNTDGQTYAEMSREDPNRSIWITATTLMTALNLGMVTYVFSALVLLLGLISVWTGMIYMALAKKF